MAISLTPVGNAVKINSASGVTVEVTLTAAVPAGKVLLLACYATSVVTVTAVTDDRANSYTILTGANTGQGTGYWVHAPVTTGLSAGQKVTATFSGTAARRIVCAFLVDGAAPSYIDAQGSSAASGTGTNPSVSTGPQAQAGETVLTWLYVTSPLVTITEASGWTTQDEAVVENRKFHVASKEMATTSADTYAPTISASQGWSANWIALKQATASGYTLTAATSSLTLTGQAATLRYSGGQGWQPVPSTPETWTQKAGKSEIWTPVGDTPEIWS